MKTKPCIKCKRILPVGQFYKHVAMGDGHLNKCIECVKDYERNRRLTDPSVREYDRARAKLPKRRQLAAKISRRWRETHPEAYRAQNKVGNGLRDGKIKKMPCQVCAATTGVHAHHNDYRRPLDVVWLCARCHHRLHALFPQLRGHAEASP